MAKLLPAIAISSVFLLINIAYSFVDNSSSSSSSGVEVSSNQREFDYFALALQWPGTYCRRTHKCCKQSGCCRSGGAPQHFTIHGLWPDYNDGTWPACCTSDNFDMKKIDTLRKALDEYWPTLSCGSTSTCHGHKGPFWAHEWEKHGTCAASVTGDEYNYFLTTINVYFKYNITEVLRDAGYVPSNSEKYPLGGVITAIENAFHTTPLITCSGDAIAEVHLCFYKDFKPRDCAFRVGIDKKLNYSKSSCPKYVSLPTYVSSGIRKGKFINQLQPGVEAL